MEKTGLAATILGFLAGLDGTTAYLTILGVLLACGLGVPIPEDITLIAAGILAGTGKISLFGAYAVSYIGIMAGDSFLFFLGRYKGRRVFTWPVFRKIFTPERIEKAELRIQKNARAICFIARFLPGLRSPIFLTAGILKVKPSTFLLQDGFAALISVPVWIYLGQWAGENMDEALAKAKEFHMYIIVFVVVFVLFAFILPRLKKKFVRQRAANQEPHS